MIKIPFEDIVNKIQEKSKLSSQDINDKVDQKMKQLSGLISKEGAAHIIANELGIKLFEAGVSGKLQIKNILAGMRNVETVGKAQQVYEVREFNTNNREGKVGSFVLADETGNIRIVMWNDQAENLNKIKAGDIVKIVGGYVRENNGRKEVHINDRSTVTINPAGETIGEVMQRESATYKDIKDLTDKDSNAEIIGTIVQAFDPRFFEVCPDCGKRTKPQEGNFVCATHGNVNPAYSYVFNVFLDDGTDNIRVVLFRNQMERLLKMNAEQVGAFRSAPEKFDAVKNDLIGNTKKFLGRVTRNDMFNRIEFVANAVFDVDPDVEVKKLNEEINKIQDSSTEEIVKEEAVQVKEF